MGIGRKQNNTVGLTIKKWKPKYISKCLTSVTVKRANEKQIQEILEKCCELREFKVEDYEEDENFAEPNIASKDMIEMIEAPVKICADTIADLMPCIQVLRIDSVITAGPDNHEPIVIKLPDTLKEFCVDYISKDDEYVHKFVLGKTMQNFCALGLVECVNVSKCQENIIRIRVQKYDKFCFEATGDYKILQLCDTATRSGPKYSNFVLTK